MLPQAIRDRSGVALPLALFTLVIAAVMITAVFYVGRLEQRMGYNSIASTQAFEAAETGVTAVLDGWDPTTYNALAPLGTISIPSTNVGSNSVYTATVQRLNSKLFLVRAEGRFLVAGTAITRRQVAKVVRLAPLGMFPEAALVTRLGLQVNGNAVINGNDQNPWGGGICPPPGPPVPAIIDSTGPIDTTAGWTGGGGLSGSAPTVVTDPVNVRTATFDQFGGILFDDLAAGADKVMPNGTDIALGPSFLPGPSCNTGSTTNWGSPTDPSGPCGNYFPVIYAQGNLELHGGAGQGILLVEGHLILSNNASFYGIIISKKTLGFISGQVYGTVFTLNENLSPSSVTGVRIDYSRCAIARAATRAAPPTALRERGWIQLY